MSFTRDDDDMLDHPKWRRALRDGGDGALLVWWRLRAWCARRLTDGVIPADMVSEIACLERSKSRARALQALIEHELCAQRADGALEIVGYLDRNPSKAQVLAARAAGIERKQKHRDRVAASREAQRPANDTPRDASTTQSQSQSQSQSQGREERARGPEPEPDSAPEHTVVRELQPSRREQEPALTEPLTHTRIPPAWSVTEAFYGEAIAAGVTRDGLDEAVRYWRGRKLGGEWFTIEDFFRAKFASIRSSEEKSRFAAAAAARAGPRRYGHQQRDEGVDPLAFHKGPRG